MKYHTMYVLIKILVRNSFYLTLCLLSLIVLNQSAIAQSGGWDAVNTSGVGAGLIDHGNGVIQLINTTSTGCQGAAVHENSNTYNPVTDGVFNKCYQVFFGCPNDDQAGSDSKGDGLAFSFSKCGFLVGGCGGGLGYSFGCPQMITIEFDTWNSQGSNGFDNAYEGAGDEDQVAIHRNGEPAFSGKIAGANPGNLEDGLEHEVCIFYDPSNGLMTVLIDGNSVLSHTMAFADRLENYFGAGGLVQTWSSGKDGATNPATITDGADISDNTGGPLCPSDIAITSHTQDQVVSNCDELKISAAVEPPAGNTTDSLEFYIDGVKVGVDLTVPYEFVWDSLAVGAHTLSALSYYSPSNTTGDVIGVPIIIESCNTIVAEIDASKLAFCEGDSVALRAIPQDASNGYQWFLNGVSLKESQLADTILWATIEGDYSVEIVNGSFSDTSDFVTITENPKPIADAGFGMTMCEDSSGVMLNGAGQGTYSWSPTDGLSDATISNPIADPSVTTTYKLSVTLGQCVDVDNVTVIVDKCLEPVTIPNVYSPNGDAVNDVWEIPGILSYKEHSVTVFNRWGNEIFASDNYIDPWDGTHNGKAISYGTYYYIIKLNNEKHQGNVTVVK